MARSPKTNALTKLKDLLSDAYIPFLGGRPKRIAPINQDDITDLKIDLWVSRDYDDFLKKL